MTRSALAVALASALLACGVRGPPRPPERAAGKPEPAAVTTTSSTACPTSPAPACAAP